MKVVLFLYVIFGAIIAGLAAEAVGAQGVVTSSGTRAILFPDTVMGDASLRFYCISGALGGAVVNLCFYKMATLREMATKLVGSSLFAVFFTPAFVHWLGTILTVDNVLAWSAGVSFFAWTIIQILQTIAPKIITKWVGDKTGTN